MTRFVDRSDAGRALAARLRAFAGRNDVVVLALTPGAVRVAYEVALALGAPLDVLLVRTLSVPRRPELVIGAIASGDVCVLDRPRMRELQVDRGALARMLARERAELYRRERACRGTTPRADLHGRVAIVVNDGLTTEVSTRAAIRALEERHAARVIVAAPVASHEVARLLAATGHEVVAVKTPEPFLGVARWYDDFARASDEDVPALLDAARTRTTPRSDVA